MVEPISGTVGIALFNALKDPLKKAYGAIKGKFDERKHNEEVSKGLKLIIESIERLIQVKTIYKGNQLVDLYSFYVPTKILKDNLEIDVHEIGMIDSKNIVIEGTAGQGKSILMRHLAYKEAQTGNRIPIFFELRRLGENKLTNSLMEIVSSWIPELNESDFNKLLEIGDICIILDGFDEVNYHHVSSLIHEIELLANKFPKTQIIISSRPNSDIQNSHDFRVYKILPYRLDKQLQLVRKLVEIDEDYEILKKSIQESSHQIKDLLNTPLMITLYVMKYNFEFEAPKNQVEFYRDLFPLLISRHDKTKAGFRRNFSSSLNESQLKDCFEAFCFYSANANKLVFSYEEAANFVEKSLLKNNLNCSPYSVIEDFSKVVCLVLNDGLEYTFIHKSIQEYFYACFLIDKPSNVKESFFQKVKDNFSDSRFLLNTINFLSIMDT